uniref:FLYWCH-type domain-containing protein n=1 Tax=Schizaphis graminum TaxID=13262 RepID=A0A2S2PHE0_SCHGA
MRDFCTISTKNTLNFLRWRCSKNSSIKCLCFLKTDLNITKPTFISINNDHVHESNENLISATKIRNLMVEKAKLTNDLPAQIFAEVVSNVPQNILAELSKEEYLKRKI